LRKSAARAAALFLGTLLLACLGAAAYLAHSWFIGRAAGEPVVVSIPRGASVRAAAERLENVGVVPDARLFTGLARLVGSERPIQYGDYEVRHGEPWGALLSRFQRGDVLRYLITIPEGMPSVLVHEKLIGEEKLTGPLDVPAEGSVLPETYAFVRGEARSAVLARMQHEMAQVIAQEWPKRTPRAAVSTPQEALTLASIVEKETGNPSERRMVAAVYSNRLRAGMRLDADPTVIYPVTRGRPLGRRILRSELQAVNGYNTYAMTGLPVGPICNPGRASIQAVLDPAESDALFFVADGSGGHIFAATYAEHQANVAKWYAIRRSRGEM
jgi:UPF0755 protein